MKRLTSTSRESKLNELKNGEDDRHERQRGEERHLERARSPDAMFLLSRACLRLLRQRVACNLDDGNVAILKNIPVIACAFFYLSCRRELAGEKIPPDS